MMSIDNLFLGGRYTKEANDMLQRAILYKEDRMIYYSNKLSDSNTNKYYDEKEIQYFVEKVNTDLDFNYSNREIGPYTLHVQKLTYHEAHGYLNVTLPKLQKQIGEFNKVIQELKQEPTEHANKNK